ncbi:hypothetical protein PAECIP111891_04755 [Paenibacillus allorhizoplanae]|uniref:PEGA domain-containing protein n=1 Tax=Paenibacillus allorhizoplanae TaxID=2905648 RepID=A0ABN8GUZ0_9BACL|nr:DUF2012 domain-containing protein [Paenibacillus allorhizoplanae]CAH1218579.1 hypothetical protein PAECIP111891_04755 [Paenibacillus allorhizoplanae]
MKKLKIFISICLLSSTLPTSVLASYTLDQDTNGVDIADVVKAIQDPQTMRTITGKNIFDQADIRNLLRQIQSSNKEASLGTITGFVTDENSAAVNKAEINIEGTSLHMQTNELGYFQFNDVPITYQTKVEVTKEGYAAASSEVFNILSGDTRNLSNLILRKIPTYGSVSGYVYGPDSLGLASAIVTVDSLSTPMIVLTNSSGYFNLSEVPTGHHNLTVTKDTYSQARQDFHVTNGSLTTIPTLQLAKVVSPQLTGSIRGVVTSATGQNLSKAFVSVTGTTYSTSTDNNGSFTLTHLPLGITALHVIKEGFQPIDIQGITVSETVYDTGTIRLSPIVIKGSISGKVTSVYGGNLPAIHITILENNTVLETDANGDFSINNLPVGDYTLQFSSPNYVGDVRTVTVSHNEVSSVPVILTPIKGIVKGTVIDEDSHFVVGATVSLDGVSATTNTSGEFTFNDVTARSGAALSITKATYETVAVPAFDLATGQIKDLSSVTIKKAKGSISGKVTSVYGGNLPAIHITILETNAMFETDANGDFTINNLPIGDYTLQFSSADYLSNVRTVTVSQNEISSVPLSLTPVKGIVKGTVIDEGGHFVVGATVSLDGVSATTNASGEFTFNDVTERIGATLVVTKATYETVTVPDFDIATGQIKDLGSVTIKKSKGSISGSVALPFGGNLASALITLTETNRPIEIAVDGRFAISDLPVGDYTLHVSAENYVGQSLTVTVTRNENTPVTVSLTPITSSVKGTLIDEEGNSVSEALVSLDGVATSTNATGQFTFEGIIPRNDAQIEITKANYETVYLLPFNLTAGETRILSDLVIKKSKGSISGRVALPFGGNLASALITLTETNRPIEIAVDGRFAISDLPVGDYTLHVSAENYVGQSLTVTVTRNENTPVTVSLTPNASIVKGTLVDEEGNSVSEALVSLDGVSTSTNAAGQFTFEGIIPRNDAQIEITKANYETVYLLPFNLSPGETKDLRDLIIKKSKGSISGSVALPFGGNLASALITLTETNRPVEIAVDGHFAIRDLPVGDYTLHVSAENYVGQSLTVTVTRNEITPVTVSLTPITSGVKGTLVDEEGNSVSEALVSLDGVSTSTNAAGEFRFDDVTPRNDAQLEVTKDNYETVYLLPFNLSPGESKVLSDLVIKKSKGSISGSVALPFGGNLASALITLTETNRPVEIDADGHFVISDLPVGDYTLHVSAENYVGQSLTVTVTRNEITPVTVSLTPNASIVKGTLVDEEGNFVSGALVSLDGVSTSTNENGEFTFNDVTPRNDAQLEVTKDNYETVHLLPFNLSPGETKDLRDLIIKKSKGSISGNITLPFGGNLASAIITIAETNRTFETDEDGHFAISDLPVGDYTLQVSAENYMGQSLTITVTRNENTPVTVSLTPITSSVKGTLIDEEGNSVSEALVSLDGVSTSTNATGQFTFDDVTPRNDAQLEVTKDNYETVYLLPFNLSPGESKDFGNLIMQKLRGSIIGSITSTTGSSLASVQIRVKGTETTAYTDASGNFTINNLPLGSYTLQISADNYIGQDISVTVTQNESSPVSVSLTHQTANVQGYARSTTGEIITYTQATIPGTSYTAYVNESGQFTFYNLPVGYTIQEIAIVDYQPKLPLTAMTVAPNLNSIGTIEFQPVGTITGVVRASDATNNNPMLANVSVTLWAIGGSYSQTVTSDAEGTFSFSNIPANASYTLTTEKSGYILYPMQPFTVSKGQNYKYLYLQQGVAVTNETQLLAAYADTSVPYILLLNDIHLTASFNFNRPISLGGVSVSNSNIKLSSPNFSISSPGVGWSGLDMYCDVGSDEMKLRAALYSFVGAINLNSLGNYDGFIKIVPQKNYFITDGTSDLTAFVNNAEGLGNALANPNVSIIYVAENIYSYGNLNLPNRSIHFTSQSEKTIQKDSYSNASQVQLTNVRLLPEHDTVPPTLTAVSTGDVELDLQDVKATLNEAATLYLVPEGTTRILAEITSHAVTNVFASTDGQATLKLASVPPGDYVLYAVDSTGNISVPSAVINVHKSLSKVLSDIRYGLEIANMTWITKYDFIRAGLQNIDGAQIELYQFALNMDKDALLSASSDQDFVAKMQGWIDVANTAPVIQRALMSGIFSTYNWAVLNNNAETILSAYQLTGISSASQLAVAEHFMELEFQRGNYKLLNRTAIQEAINDSLPSPELSNWAGTPIQQGLGTKHVALRLSIKNTKGISLKGYTANDLTVKINGEETSLSDSEIFPSFVYDNVSSSYQIVFAGEESSTTYTLSDLSLRGVVIQAEELSVTTPDLGIPVTSIGISIYTNSNRIPTNSSSTVSLNIAPNNATNKDIVWSIEPSGIATISQEGYLNVTGTGHFTLTAKNALYGISQTLELEAVDSGSALGAVQAYAASGGTASLTLDDLKNTCVGNIVDTAFENYKRAIVAKRAEFVGLQNYQISNLLGDIIREYTSTASLNQALYAYVDNYPTAWDAMNLENLIANGVYHADATNVQYVKQVILDVFMEDGGPLGRTQLNTLLSKVPSFSIRDYNPTVYATQMISQHLKSDGSNVVLTFKVANLYNEGNTGLTSQDVKAIVGGETRGLNDSALFSNFLNLGGGVYSFEVLQSALATPLWIDALKVRVGYSYIPIATEISVSRQAALIEHSVANHTLNIVDELLFTAGNLPSILGLNFIQLSNNLESAYTAHGNVLTEGSIRRIINGMRVIASYHQTQSASTDTYSLAFDQDITGNLFYSVTARNLNGYLGRYSTGYSTNVYDFSFGHTSTFPVVLTYIADAAEKLRYSRDNSVVPDFEIIFTNPSS